MVVPASPIVARPRAGRSGWLAGSRSAAQRVLGWFFPAVQPRFRRATDVYTGSVGRLLRVSVLVLVVYGGLLVPDLLRLHAQPRRLHPAAGQGLPARQRAVARRRVGRADRGGDAADRGDRRARRRASSHTVAIAGQSLLLNANAPNFGSMYVMLDDFHQRHGRACPATRSPHGCERALRRTRSATALINVFGAPPVEGLGTAGGFKIMIEDRGDIGLDVAAESIAEQIVAARQRHDPDLQRPVHQLPRQHALAVPRHRPHAGQDAWACRSATSSTRCRSTSARSTSTTSTASAAPGRSTCRPTPDFRKQIEDLKQLKVRNEQGDMVPLGDAWPAIRECERAGDGHALQHVPGGGDQRRRRPGHQLRPGDRRDGASWPVETLPPSMRTEWTELALLAAADRQHGHAASFVLAVVLVFLVLAAQYESWSLPLAVILVVPMCLLCSIAGVLMAQMDINIFTQIGFVVLVGLACKNAILIVEFAKHEREAGHAALRGDARGRASCGCGRS